MATAERTRSNPMDSRGFSENEKMDTHQMGSTQMSSQQDSRFQNTLFQELGSSIDQNMGSQTQGQSGSKRSQRQKDERGGTTISMIKTIRKTEQVIQEENPPRSRQSGSRIQDFEEDKTDYDEFSSERRKNKVMKMIKNSHIEKIKNYIYLKEIDNAYDEMIRLRASGDIAASKEMERELNSLTTDIISSNIDAFEKTQMAKSHAMSRRSGTFSSQFYDSKKSREKKDVKRSQKDSMYRTVYTTNNTRVVNRHSEDIDEEESQYEDDEESQKKKRKKKKNKSIKDNNMKKRKNKSNAKAQGKINPNSNNPNNYNQYGNNPNNNNQYGNNPNNNNQYGYNPNNFNQYGYNPNNFNQYGNNPNNFNQYGYNPNNNNQYGYNPNINQPRSNDPNYNQNNNGPNSNQNYNQNYPNYNGPNNNPNYSQNYQDPYYNQNNIPNNRDQSYNAPNNNNQSQNPKSSSPDNQNPMYSQNFSNYNQDNQSITRAQIMDIRQKDRYNNIFDSQGSVDSSLNRLISDQEKENINKDDKNRPGSSQDRSRRSNDPIIDNSHLSFDDEKDKYGSLTQEKIDQIGQELIDQQQTYKTEVIGSIISNPNQDGPNKIGPNSEVPKTEKENTPETGEKEKTREPLASDTLHPSSQSSQPEKGDQSQIVPKVLRNPGRDSSSPELQITSNQLPKPNDPSGGETGRFPSSVHNPKLNPGSIPDYPSRYQYQGTRPKKPSPKKRSPNYGPRGYPSKNPQFPNNPRNPSRDNPRYPSRGNPLNPPRGNPRYPSRDNPRNPKRGNPRNPLRGNPRYPPGENPQYPSGDNPRYPPGENPQYPSGDNPRYPPGENPQYPSGDNPRYAPGDNPRYPQGDYPRGPNYPPNTSLDSGMRRPFSTRGSNPRPKDPNFGYPRRYGDESRGRGRDITFGDTFGRSHSRSNPKSRRQSPADIPYSYPTGGRCFACDVNCSISRSGNSPNKYIPYYASMKKERKAVTDYDAEKYGYYQYSSTFSKKY